MDDLSFSIFNGLISGVISSLVFFWILSRMQPKLLISSIICKSQNENGTFYCFKIINNSRYSVLDLKIEVLLKTPYNTKGGSNHTVQWLNLRRDCILQFPGYNVKDKNGDYALIITTKDELEQLWAKDSQSIEIRAHGKHAFSGISKSFAQKYYTKRSDIKSGMFNFGKSLEIE